MCPNTAGTANLLLARLISALGTWTAFFAVRIALYNQTNSAWWVSILLFCELVPGVILGIAVGPLIDRWPRKRMMIFSDLGGAATFGLLPFVHSPAAICALSAVAGFSSAFFRPACYSAIPNLVRKDSLVAANALIQGSENFATLMGPVLAGVGIALLGSGTVYALNAVSFLASAFLLLRIGTRLQSSVAARIGRTHWREVRAGLSLVRDDRHLSSIFLIWSWATLAYTGINVAEIVLTNGCVRRRQRRLRGLRRVLGRRHPDRQRRGVLVHQPPDGLRRLPRIVPRHSGRRGDLRRQPEPRDRVRRCAHLRDRERHRARLQRHADPAGRLRRATGARSSPCSGASSRRSRSSERSPPARSPRRSGRA